MKNPVGTGASTVYSGGGNKKNSNCSNGQGGSDPLIDVKLDLKFGLEFKENLKLLGLGNEVDINALSVDMLTWEWNSETKKTIYTPYKSINSSAKLGALSLFGAVEHDWINSETNFKTLVGLFSAETKNPFRFNILDIGNMFGFGYNIKVTMSPRKVMNYYFQQQVDWNQNVRQTMWHYMH